jgi:hypothetical protein
MKPHRRKFSRGGAETRTILVAEDGRPAFSAPTGEFTARTGHFPDLLDSSRGGVVEFEFSGVGGALNRNG